MKIETSDSMEKLKDMLKKLDGTYPYCISEHASYWDNKHYIKSIEMMFGKSLKELRKIVSNCG